MSNGVSTPKSANQRKPRARDRSPEPKPASIPRSQSVGEQSPIHPLLRARSALLGDDNDLLPMRRMNSQLTAGQRNFVVLVIDLRCVYDGFRQADAVDELFVSPICFFRCMI